MKRAISVFASVVVFSALTCGLVWAQGGTAQISGTVKDQTGAVLPGVEVTATQTATGIARNVITNETGSFVLPNLAVGPYRVEAGLPGFRTYVQTGIVLQIGGNPVFNISLEVGQVTEQVEVQADAAMVETRSTGVGQVIDNTRVIELPLNGRNVQELIILSGMAVGGGNQSNQRNYPADVISVGGGLQDGLTYILDGGTHNEPVANQNLPLPFPDAVQEFKVEASSLPAQYGQHSSGVVNVVTKSGTNDFHGSLFEFVRNGAFNARNAFATERDGLKRNQFGGTIGGAIVKNKLFFFAGEQATLQRSRPNTADSFVPTPAMMAGDWTAITSPACNQGRQITLRAPFVNNRIDPALFSTPALNLQKQWLPTPIDSCGTLHVGRRDDNTEHIIIGKMDFQHTAKNSLFGRYELARMDTPSNYDGKNFLSVTSGDYVRRAHSFVLGDTYLIGSDMVSSFRGTVNYSPNSKELREFEFFTFTDLGVKNLYYPPGQPKFAIINVTGAFNRSNTPTPNNANTTAFQFAEDLGVSRGTHQYGFGMNYIHSIVNLRSNTTSPGSFTFNGSNTGLALADLMVGRPSQWAQTQETTQYYRQNYIASYVQDTWKVNSRLTLNGGVRWEPDIPAYDKIGHIATFEQKWFDQGIRSTLFKNAPAGVLFTAGDPQLPDTNSMSSKHWMRFSPRVGLAWDPEGSGQTVVRAAYGMFYDYRHLAGYGGFKDTPPRGTRVSLSNPVGGFEDPWQGYPGGNPIPVILTPNVSFPTAGVYTMVPRDLKKPYVNTWNLNIQRQIGADWLVSGSYVGSNIIHMMYRHEGNPAIYMPGASCVIAGRTYSPCSTTSNTNQRRVLYLQNPDQGQYYSNLVMADDANTRNYNGMTLSVQRRRARGVTVQGNYTWSHCIDGGYEDSIQTTGGQTIERRPFNRGNCELDRRHNFNMSTVYETPQFSNTTLRFLGSGWRVSGIVRLLSGAALTVITNVDQALSGTSDQRPNQVLPSLYASNKNVDLWLNPAAFAMPALGTYGNIGSQSVRGPGRIRIDMGLTRTFNVREKQSLEFRAEAFNLPNHMNPDDPVLTLNSSTFGKILSAADARIMQFALKYVF